MIDYDVGDVVVCIESDLEQPTGCPIPLIYKGTILRCAVIHTCPKNGVGVGFDGKSHPEWFYYADRFRKLPKADPGFTTLIKALNKPKVVEPA